MSILGVLRTGRVPGRGDALYPNGSSPMRIPKPRSPKPAWSAPTPSGSALPTSSIASSPWPTSTKSAWPAIRRIPACRPRATRACNRVLGTVDGLKKFITIQESPWHGLNFCQGTISEDLEDPGIEIFDVIRYFGTRKKIFNVHFRNIRGHRNDFIEVFPDEGDVDFVKAIRVYKEVGYPYMLMPDHVPLGRRQCRSQRPPVLRLSATATFAASFNRSATADRKQA